jgi:hypothetical protein
MMVSMIVTLPSSLSMMNIIPMITKMPLAMMIQSAVSMMTPNDFFWSKIIIFIVFLFLLSVNFSI